MKLYKYCYHSKLKSFEVGDICVQMKGKKVYNINKNEVSLHWRQLFKSDLFEEIR